MKMIKNIFKNKLLLFILLVGFVIRAYSLSNVPNGFHADEAAFGYNAYSILQTGKDEYGEVLPLIIRSFDDYKGALYVYLTVPSVAFLGLTEFAVRLPTAVFGVLFILLSYLLSFKLTKDKKISLLTSLLIAINPLSVFLSRVQSDPLVSIFLVLFGFYTFLLWIEGDRKHWILLSVFTWIASIYTYPSPRVLLPVLFASILFFYYKKISLSKKRILVLALLTVFLIDFFVIIGASQRLKQLSIFNAPIVTLPMEESIREDANNNVLITRFFHNKIIAHSLAVGKNYFDYFTPDFLFLKGGQPDREKIPGVGILYLVELPFLLYGLYLGFRNKEKWGKLSIFLILSFPFALSFAVDESPNVHRYYINIFFLELLVSLGIIDFFYNLKVKHRLYHKPTLFLLAAVFILNFLYFTHQLFVHQPVHQPWYRGYAYKELVSELEKIEKKYKKIIFTKANSSPYIYLLFFKKYDPKVYQKKGSPRDFDYKGFDNYVFVPEDCPLGFHTDKFGKLIVRGEEDTLYINKGSCPIPPKSVRLIKVVNWKDNNPAFSIIEKIKK